MKGFIVAANSTHAGKTSITLALCAILHGRGIKVQPAKCGPDFIDPKFLTFAAAREAVNLDPFAMTPDLIQGIANKNARNSDYLVVEGVMGLFDGASKEGVNGRGATADLARVLNIPIVLVVNCQGLGHSVAALVKGFLEYDPSISMSGVILNKVASARHEAILREALETVDCPVIGAVPRDEVMALGERHLGLIQAGETENLKTRIMAMAEHVAANVDLEKLFQISSSPCQHIALDKRIGNFPTTGILPPLGQRIAIAQDLAFAFSYQHLLDHWQDQGAELSFFSPLKGEIPPADSNAVYIPGGYPELHLKQLSSQTQLFNRLHVLAENHVKIYGECGGYMLLGRGIVGAEDNLYPMAGLLSHITSFAKRKLHLGYKHVKCVGEGVLGKACQLVGHEFHYAVLTDPGKDEPLFETAVYDQDEGAHATIKGGQRGLVAGSFLHVITHAKDCPKNLSSDNCGH